MTFFSSDLGISEQTSSILLQMYVHVFARARDTGTFCEQTVVTLAGIRGQLTARGV